MVINLYTVESDISIFMNKRKNLKNSDTWKHLVMLPIFHKQYSSNYSYLSNCLKSISDLPKWKAISISFYCKKRNNSQTRTKHRTFNRIKYFITEREIGLGFSTSLFMRLGVVELWVETIIFQVNVMINFPNGHVTVILFENYCWY